MGESEREWRRKKDKDLPSYSAWGTVKIDYKTKEQMTEMCFWEYRRQKLRFRNLKHNKKREIDRDNVLQIKLHMCGHISVLTAHAIIFWWLIKKKIELFFDKLAELTNSISWGKRKKKYLNWRKSELFLDIAFMFLTNLFLKITRSWI